MAEFEDNFRIANREAVNVRDASPQNEGVVVEAEIGRVAKDDFADLWPLLGFGILNEAHTRLLCRLLHEFAKVSEALHGGKTIRFQDELCFQILNTIERSSISVSRARDGWV